MNTNLIDFRKLPSVNVGDIGLLPRRSGVYFALNGADELLYVGKTFHLRNRWRNHHKAGKLLSSGFKKLHWLEVGRDDCAELEAAYINEYRPPLNIRIETGKSPGRVIQDQETVESTQINITIGRQVRSDFQALADFQGIAVAGLLRQILNTQWGDPGMQELIERARKHNDGNSR